MCGATKSQWRVIEKRLRKRGKYRVICLSCEFIWETNNGENLLRLKDEEKRELEHPYAL